MILESLNPNSELFLMISDTRTDPSGKTKENLPLNIYCLSYPVCKKAKSLRLSSLKLRVPLTILDQTQNKKCNAEEENRNENPRYLVSLSDLSWSPVIPWH